MGVTSSQVVLLSSTTVTSSGETMTFSTQFAREAVFFLDVTAVSGTTPTLDVKVQSFDPASGKYFTVASFPQITAAGQYVLKVDGGLGHLCKVAYTLGGTSPSFTMSLGVSLKG